MTDRGELASLLRKGADKAGAVAAATLDRAYTAIGFVPRSTMRLRRELCQTPFILWSLPDFPRSQLQVCVGRLVVSVVEVAQRLAAVDPARCDRAAVEAALADASRLISWAQARQVALAARLNELAESEPGMFPEQVMASASLSDVRHASRAFQRVGTVRLLPELRHVFEEGLTSARHVDVVVRAVRELDRATACAVGAARCRTGQRGNRPGARRLRSGRAR